MMKRPPFARSTAAALALSFLPLTGCDKPGTSNSNTAPAIQKVESAVAAAIPAIAPVASAEPNSFDEVAARLDRGGSLYFYLSTEQWLSALSQQLVKWRDLARTATADQKDPATAVQIDKAFDIATDLVKQSGLEDITGLGASSFAVERGVYRNKLFVHHYAGKGTGFLWSMMGKAPHPLTALDLLPADTALAGFMDFDVAQVINTLRAQVEKAGVPEAKMAVDQALLQFSAVAGMTLDELLTSLGGGGGGMLLTLDPEKPVTLTIDGKPTAVPAPRLALVIQVKNDRLFQQIDKTLGVTPNIIRVDEPNLRMRTMPVPVMPELGLRATAAQWGDYLVLATDDKIVRDMIAAKTSGQGLKATPEFARIAAGLPTEGNGFQIMTERFAETLNRYQGDLMKTNTGPGVTPEQIALVQKLFGEKKATASYSVTGHVDNGWLAVGKGSLGAGQLIAPLVILPVAVVAGAAVPMYSKLQNVTKVAGADDAEGKAGESLTNAKQLATGCRLYAIDNNGKFPPTLLALIPDYIVDPSILVSPFNPDEPNGYKYVAGLTDSAPPDTELIEDKFSAAQGQRVVVYADTSGKVIPVTK